MGSVDDDSPRNFSQPALERLPIWKTSPYPPMGHGLIAEKPQGDAGAFQAIVVQPVTGAGRLLHQEEGCRLPSPLHQIIMVHGNRQDWPPPPDSCPRKRHPDWTPISYNPAAYTRLCWW